MKNIQCFIQHLIYSGVLFIDFQNLTKNINKFWCKFSLLKHFGILKVKFLNPLPHGHISSSTIPLRLIPQVEGQNIRPKSSWRFFDRTSYKPSSSRQKFAQKVFYHIVRFRYSSLALTSVLQGGPKSKAVASFQ